MQTSRFPVIENINDVMPYVIHKDEFRVKENPGYITIDYAVQTLTSWDSLQARECRGIKFYLDGQIMARPFHKFFNRGERPDEEPSSLEGVKIQEKLDGCMIHPGFDHRGELVFMTRAGRTDIARMVEAPFLSSYREHCSELLKAGLTPIFEYMGPTNTRLGFTPVLPKAEPRLVLLAVRKNVTGDYLPVEDYANEWPIVDEYDPTILEMVKEWTGQEGVVLSWPDGFKLKIKSDDYVLKHKTMEAVSAEKNVLALVLDDEIDDLANILDGSRYHAIQEYAEKVRQTIDLRARQINELADDMQGRARKEVALYVSKLYENYPAMQGIFWQVYDGKDPRTAIINMIRKHLTKQSRIDQIRYLIGGELALS